MFKIYSFHHPLAAHVQQIFIIFVGSADYLTIYVFFVQYKYHRHINNQNDKSGSNKFWKIHQKYAKLNSI